MGWFRSSLVDTHAPQVNETPDARRRLRFCDLKAGQSGIVVSIDSDSPSTIRLQEMGLSVGAEFRIVEVAPFGDPIQVCLRGYRLCLRKREAKEFEVEITDRECPCADRP